MDADLNQGLTVLGSLCALGMNACMCDDGKPALLLRYYSLFCMGHNGVTLPLSISTQLTQAPISAALAAVLIAQEETWFTPPGHYPHQVHTARVTKCHRAPAAEDLGIVLNERHV